MPSSLFDLSGRVAVVSGAARGMGRAMAPALAEHGADLLPVDRNAAGVEQTAAEIAATGPPRRRRRRATSPSPTNRRAVRATRPRVWPDRFSGKCRRRRAAGSARRHDGRTIRSVLENLVLGRFPMCQEAGRRMLRAGRGSIVNIGSLASTTALGRGHVAYSMAMGAVVQMTRELSTEWSGRGVRVNAILPAQVVNPSLEAADGRRPESRREVSLSGIPAGRLGRPDDIQGLSVFLASDSSSWITGR